MSFDPGIDVRVTERPMGFQFGPDVFGPTPEYRSLDSIRPSLYDPASDGPDPVYAIAMDVGKREHQPELEKRYLLFGVVTYAAGRLGNEPVRSQGHVHRVSAHSGWSPPEVYEIWRGRGIVYMQEFADDDPGRCFAVVGEPGDVIVVPPGWAHATISADPQTPLTFAAWCDREYGFVYDNVRARCGLAWYALLDDGGQLKWHRIPITSRGISRSGLPSTTASWAWQKERRSTPSLRGDPQQSSGFRIPLRKENWAYFTPCRTEVH